MIIYLLPYKAIKTQKTKTFKKLVHMKKYKVNKVS